MNPDKSDKSLNNDCLTKSGKTDCPTKSNGKAISPKLNENGSTTRSGKSDAAIKTHKSEKGEVLRKITRFLFPVNLTCNICGREIFQGYFCKECQAELPLNDKTVCNHCGRHVFNSEEYCFSCNGRDTFFNRARSAFNYEEPIRGLISALKYNGKRYLSEVFAEYLSNVYYSTFFNSDVIVYPPMSKERIAERGYNHARLIAHELSRLIGVPVCDNVFEKIKETARQATLDAKERRENLKGSFRVIDKTPVTNKRVLIVDDVMTTGATVETLSQLLIKSGAAAVDVITVASVAKGSERHLKINE